MSKTECFIAGIMTGMAVLYIAFAIIVTLGNRDPEPPKETR